MNNSGVDSQAKTAVNRNIQPSADYNPSSKTQSSVQKQKVGDVYGTLKQIRAEHLKNMSLDQKLELVFSKALTAERMAANALRTSTSLEKQLERIFKKEQENQQQDSVADSIFDEEDPESIMSGW